MRGIDKIKNYDELKKCLEKLIAFISFEYKTEVLKIINQKLFWV